ncbi:MAG: hypothetical protein EZS28_024836 [Streblomastix strix]|uniref:Uncharacterized protein n=1 Tax=Streblomastix strix TaxID=222440 RepID=A0A5J4VAZ0_9EUKA|nr:MAG: hypothetical protein EZS28_024836 [Streblomastix strix]
MPLGPLPPDRLLVYGVGDSKKSECDDKQTQREGQTFSTDARPSYSSYAVAYSARNRFLAKRARNQSIFDRPRDTITER